MSALWVGMSEATQAQPEDIASSRESPNPSELLVVRKIADSL
jgi:hypothetical protein